MRYRYFWLFARIDAEEERNDKTPDPWRARLFRTLDGAASNLVVPRFCASGLEYKTLIFNPFDVGAKVSCEPRLDPSDLLVTVTRPPLNDKDSRKKRVPLSKTELEERIHAGFRTALQCCSRTRIEFKPGIDYSPSFEFSNPGWTAGKAGAAMINRAVTKKEGYETTVGFVIHIPSIGEAPGPGVLAIFGVGGIETMCFAYLLTTRAREWDRVTRLCASNIAAAAIGTFYIPEVRVGAPLTLQFLDDSPEISWRLWQSI